MNNPKQLNSVDMPKDFANALIALQRAAIRAREIAKQTHTPLIIVENGEVKKVWP